MSILTKQKFDMLYHHISENYKGLTIGKWMSLTENEKVQVSRTLIDRIYVTIAERYNQIDFGEIPKSKGNIAKMKEYGNLKASLELLSEIASDSKQNIPEIDTLTVALRNIERLADKFEEGFMKKSSGVIMLYNLLTLALYCGTSLMISVLVDYVNLSNTDSVQIIIDKKYSKTNSYLLIDTLKSFNDQVRRGAFQKTLNEMMRPARIQESVIATAAKIGLIVTAIMASFAIIPLTKEIIYLFYYSRMKFSEAAEIQANLINANIEKIKATGVATPRMVKIQKWFADKLMRIANIFAIKYEKSEKKALSEAKARLTPNDIVLF